MILTREYLLERAINGYCVAEIAKACGQYPAAVREALAAHLIELPDGRVYKTRVTRAEAFRATTKQDEDVTRSSTTLLSAKIRRMHDVGHPPGVIAMVCALKRDMVVRVLGLQNDLIGRSEA